MSRYVVAAAFTLLLSAPAFAQNQNGPSGASSDKDAKLRAAIAACDKGASVPLEPSASEPPIQYNELLPADFDTKELTQVSAACKEAFLGALGTPDQKRLKLEWLRTVIALGADSDFMPFLSDLRQFAADGSPEANYLLFEIYRTHAHADGGPPISRGDGLAALRTAAEAGHQDALASILYEYVSGPDLRRDPKEVAHFAEALMNLPPQGKQPGVSEANARKLGKVLLGRTLVTADGFSDAEQAKGFAIVKELYDGKEDGSLVPYVTALRYGRGTPQDAAAARQLLDDAVARRGAGGVSRPRRHAGQGRGRTRRRQTGDRSAAQRHGGEGCGDASRCWPNSTSTIASPARARAKPCSSSSPGRPASMRGSGRPGCSSTMTRR